MIQFRKVSIALGCIALGSSCSGEDAVSSIILTSNEAAGANCDFGGLKVETGLDTNGDGILDADEVEDTNYICSGSDGTNGTDGANGLQTLVSTTPEVAGANCTSGGQRIDVGIDDNSNGVLDAGEIDDTTFSCNGEDGLESLIDIVPIAAGFDCPDGGQTVNHGIDDNGNGTLEVGEIDGTADICAGGCQSAPFVVTKDFTGLGTFTTPELDQEDVSIIGAPGIVNVLNFNGLGVVGGLGDNVIDDGESLTYTFARPALAISYFVSTAGAGNGVATIEAFDIAGASLGTAGVSSTGTKNVSAQFGDVAITSFQVTSALGNDFHRQARLTFTTCD